MEPINDQYSNRWNDHLYIYTDRSLCHCRDNEYYDQHTGNTNIHPDRTTLPKQCGTNITGNIRQWLCRNMEPCNDQYSNSRNNDLHIYTNRSLCYYRNNEYYDQHTGNTNIHSDRTTLPE